jgi:hypothetical protein
MYYNQYTDLEKEEVASQLKNYSLDDSLKDYNKLVTGVNNGIDTIAPLSLVGIKFIEHFIYPELLNTKTKQGISFYDFWYNRAFYMVRDDSTKNLINYIKKEKPKLNEIKQAKKVFNLYYGSVNVFRPTIAVRLYETFKPTCVLDFTMGWGGRLVGACVANVPKYIGIDYNENLKKPYELMCSHLNKLSTTDATLIFSDSRKIDYSKFSYDMVFTSPPYYNKETYGGKTTYNTEEDWDTHFYLPLFKSTWNSMIVGGYYCLNIPSILYDKICVPLFKQADEMMELKKFSRTLPTHETNRKNVGQKYKEYIYIWIKQDNTII